MLRAVMWGFAALATALALSGCASKGRLAPVDDHSIGINRAPAARVMPGAENAGKPGYYTVKPGDTLIRIGMDNGQSWRDILRWNKLDNANLIETGQVLRVAPPPPEPEPVARPAVVAPAPVAATASPAKAAASAPTSAPTPAPTPAPSAPATAAEVADEAVNFQWPARGNLLASFDESKNKGLDISGKVGDPVLAAADGRVVYAGAGLRGYGNLIILKHNNTFLTAYAHNQTLLVKEDQVIKRGQKIAEMGSSDADQVKLHFEIRRQGKPVDPAKYLPSH
jgi:lipoprotein NlpD